MKRKKIKSILPFLQSSVLNLAYKLFLVSQSGHVQTVSADWAVQCVFTPAIDAVLVEYVLAGCLADFLCLLEIYQTDRACILYSWPASFRLNLLIEAYS